MKGKHNESQAILKASRHRILELLMKHRKIREIASDIGVSYWTLYNYLAMGRILNDGE